MSKDGYLMEKLVLGLVLVMGIITAGVFGESVASKYFSVAEPVTQVSDLFPVETMSDEFSVPAPAVIWFLERGVNSFTIYEGDTAYFQEGSLHNANGPALVHANGDAPEYFIWGTKYTDMAAFNDAALLAQEVDRHVRSASFIFDDYGFRIQAQPDEFASADEHRTSFNDLLQDMSGPAVSGPAGYEAHYYMGSAHCEDGPAVVSSFGSKVWAQFGWVHREDGPAAIFSDGTEWYMQNGVFHREDGPAIIWNDGAEVRYEYWVNGRQMSEFEFLTRNASDYDSLASVSPAEVVF